MGTVTVYVDDSSGGSAVLQAVVQAALPDGIPTRTLIGRTRYLRFHFPVSGNPWPMFVFFSSRLGCLGSILVSVVATVVLILLLRA